MEDDVRHFVLKVCSSVKSKKPHIIPAEPMQSIFYIWTPVVEAYNIFWYSKIQVSRFVQVYATTNKSAKTAANRLHNNFILRYGLPGNILHDLGKESENTLFTKFSKLCGIKRYGKNTIRSPNQQTN